MFSPYMNHSYISVCVCVCELALIYLTHDYYNYHHVLQNSSYMPLWIFLSCNRTTFEVMFQILLVEITSYKCITSNFIRSLFSMDFQFCHRSETNFKVSEDLMIISVYLLPHLIAFGTYTG